MGLNTRVRTVATSESCRTRPHTAIRRSFTRHSFHSLLLRVFLISFSASVVAGSSAWAAPAITSLSPSEGAVGTSVTISGSGFDTTQGTSTVTFNGTTAAPSTWSDTTIAVPVPAGATTGSVVVTVGGLDSNAVTFSVTVPVGYIYDALGRLRAVIDSGGDTATYNYDAVGNLTSITRQNSSVLSVVEFSPTSGPIGATVTVYGTGFSTTANQNTVTFNGTAATVNSATAAQLVVTVPSGATSGLINVTTPGGSASSASVFTVTGAPGTPTITSFSPTIGIPGTAVTITGTNYVPNQPLNNNVGFNGRRAQVSSATSTSIATSVPLLAGSGHISVTTPAGKVISTADFIVPPSPYGPSDVALSDRMTIGGTKNVTISSANKIAMILFDGTFGQHVFFFMNSSTTCAAVSILKPNGTVLASNTNLCSQGLIDTQVLPITGTYTIVIDPPGTNTGTFNFTLFVPVDIVGTITAGGPTVTVNLTTYGQNALLTFTGTTGQRVSLVGSSTNSCAVVRFLKPDGSILASGAAQICSNPSYIDTQTLPVNGVYTVLIDPPNTNTGTFSVNLYNVTDVNTNVTSGVTVTADLSTPGQNAHLFFTGVSGHRVSWLINTSNISNCSNNGQRWIFKPDGTNLTPSNGGICAGAFIDATSLPVNGTYQLFIDPVPTSPGVVTTTYYDVPADTTQTTSINSSAVTVTITTPGQNGTVTFNSSSTQQVTVRITNNTVAGASGCVTVKLLNPSGTQLTSTSSCSASFNLAQQTLTATGTYTVVVDGVNQSTGNLTVSVTNP